MAAENERVWKKFVKMFDGLDPPTETEDELARIISENDESRPEYWNAYVKNLKLDNDKRAKKWPVEVVDP